MKTEKVAIILPGGGMRCAYTAGVLTALGKNMGITTPSIAVAASGSVAPLFYYLTKQYAEGEKAWLQFLSSNRFIRYFPFPRIDVDYLVDTVMKQYLPLDTDRLAEVETRYFVPVTDEDTGVTQFISNATWFDPYEVMRAAKAIPVLYHRHVFLGAHHFMDGGFGASNQALIDKAVAEGATRILLVTNFAPQKKSLFPRIFRMYAYWQRKPLEDVLLAFSERTNTISVPPGVRSIHISPTELSPVGVNTRNRRKVAEAFYMGYDDAMEKRAEILELFKS